MNQDDARLFKKIKRGDLEAFEVLFRKYYSELCTLAARYLPDKDTSEEVVQDLFCKIWEKRSELTIETSLRAYLGKAVYFNSINIRNDRHREVSLSGSRAAADKGLLPEEVLEWNEINDLVEATMNKLPEKGRQIFRLSRFEGLKYREIAERLSVSVKTVEAYMSQALKVFRKSMKEYI